ncbi:hypothetical protein ACWGA9_09415 [Streptomyces sp. NPDC054950]
MTLFPKLIAEIGLDEIERDLGVCLPFQCRLDHPGSLAAAQELTARCG